MEKEFSLEECRVRLALPTDKKDLLIVAKGIWGGTDYLPRVIDRWLAEPWFWVCEYRGRAVACLKMSLFPDSVLWFEGLRVKVSLQNRGIATLMNRHAFAFARQLKKASPGLSYEFCTYYLNVESLHLTQKLGFKIVEKFYTLHKRGVQATARPQIIRDFGLEHFSAYPRYIPCAWQALHNTPASLPFLREHGCLFQTPFNTYYLGGLHEPNVTLLNPPNHKLRHDLPYFQYFFGSRISYNVILPRSSRNSLPLLNKAGFRFWEQEEIENMLILRM